jgi:prepilin-type N-terminal cleavage/methylation domain-containing protein
MKQITDNRKQKTGNRKQNKLLSGHCYLITGQKGFTLIEVIISVAIFSMIAYGVTELVSSLLVNSTVQGSLLANNDSARRASFALMQELRNATTSVTGGYALEAASAQQLIFYTNAGTGINRIRYYIQSGALYKGITKPTGNPLIYNLGTETVNLVQKDVANGANPIFYYYDGSYSGVIDNPLVQPVNVTAVKFVKISLVIYKKTNPGSVATYTVTASGSIRNLKTNLAN